MRTEDVTASAGTSRAEHVANPVDGHSANVAPAAVELTILMPCLNEAETLATCINKARDFLERTNTSGEILVADNGSTDGSQKIAEKLGARVVPVAARGYGAALLGGIDAARGTYIIMGDADDSYDFSRLEPFLEKLREGYDLVMGNRFKRRHRTGRHAVPALLSGQPGAELRRPAFLRGAHWRLPLRAQRLPDLHHPRPGAARQPEWSSRPKWSCGRAWPGCALPRCRPRSSPMGGAGPLT